MKARVPKRNIILITAIRCVGVGFTSSGLSILVVIMLLLLELRSLIIEPITKLSIPRGASLLLLFVRQRSTLKRLVDPLTTARTLSVIASLARSIASLDPINPILRSTSRPEAGETLILHPVAICISLMVSPPRVAVSLMRINILGDDTAYLSL